MVAQTLEKEYKQTELGLIPEDWSIKSIGEISQVVRGGSPRPAGDPKYFGGNFIPWLTVAALTNIPESQIYVCETKVFLTEEGSKLSRTLSKNTVIISNSGATLGVAKILGVKCCANDGIAALLKIEKNIHPLYLYYYLNSITQKLRETVATGVGQPNLNTTLIGEIRVPVPSTKEEQIAIINVLFDIDSLIESLNRLIEKKKNIKQGAMQELLTGRKRLARFLKQSQVNQKHTEIGMVSEDWKVENILENSTLKARIGWQGLTTAEYLTSGSYYLVTGTDFQNGRIDWNTCVFITEKRYSQDRNIQLKREDVLVTKDGTIGKIAYVTYLPLPATLNSGIFVIRPRGKAYFPLFLYYILTSNYFRAFLNKLQAGSTINHLYQKDFEGFNFIVPEYREQEEIARILWDMDKEIEELEKIRDKHKQLKIGMMQRLLSGRIRLKWKS